MKRRLVATASLLGLASLAVPACFSTDNGPLPDPNEIDFPTSVVVSPRGTALFVINSDFDLQFKAGTIQILDLPRMRKLVPPLWCETDDSDACAGPKTVTDLCARANLGTDDPSGQLLFPGPCSPINLVTPPLFGPAPIIVDHVDIGAFATDAALALRPDASVENGGGARLVVPVRGDPSLTFVDVDDDRVGPQHFRLDCDRDGDSRCADDHKAGIDPGENTRSQTMPGDPFAVAVSDDASSITVTHQTSGAVSLFLNGWGQTSANASCPSKLPSRPELAFVLGGLPVGATGLAAMPEPRLAMLDGTIPFEPAFAVSYRTAAELDVVRYVDDCQAAPARPFLQRTAQVAINTNALGYDSRSIAVDARARHAAEAACSSQAVPKTADVCPDETIEDPASEPPCVPVDCLVAAAGVPVGVYVANRTPPSLLVGRTRTTVSPYGTNDVVDLGKQIALSQGASRVQIGQVLDKEGKLQTRVFVVCFDAHVIYVYDPAVEDIEAVIFAGRGPSALAFDPTIACASSDQATRDAFDAAWPANGCDTIDTPGAYAYVAQFTDSYIATLDLDMRHSTYLSFVASFGVPHQPPESQH